MVWRQSLPPASACCGDIARSIALDFGGNVLAGGSQALGIQVAKFSQDDGTVLWRRGIGGTQTVNSLSRIVVDSHNDVAFAGFTRTAGTNDNDFTVAKLAGNTGQIEWFTAIDGIPSHGNDNVNDIAVDSKRNVYVTGVLRPNAVLDEDLAVLKFTPKGAEIWSYSFTELSVGNAIVLDSKDNVVVAGEQHPSQVPDFLVVKINGKNGKDEPKGPKQWD